MPEYYWYNGDGSAVSVNFTTKAPSNPTPPTPIAEDEDMAKLANKFEVGCDPEFCILDPSGGLVKCTSLGKDGPVGYDHSGRCAEVHPEKAMGTWTLTKRIAEILNHCPKLADYRHSNKWRGGAEVQFAKCNCGKDGCMQGKLSLGGHVHFNIAPHDWKPAYTEALNKLATLLEKLDILPEKECQARRKHKLWDNPTYCYGTENDAIRASNDGTHVEYRTFASWLYDPWIAFLCLTAAKLAVIAPENAEQLSGPPSVTKLQNFVEAFRHKDINADRLLEKFDAGKKWLVAKPDNDLKSVWEGI